MLTKTPSRKTLTDQASELKEQVSPHVEAARDRIVNDYLPVAQTVLADAGATAKEVAQDVMAAAQEAAVNVEKSTRKSRKQAAKNAKAKARQAATAAAATPAAVAVMSKVKPEPKKSGRKKWVFMLLALAGAGAVVFKRMGGSPAPTPSYAPPRPVADPVATTPPVPRSPVEPAVTDAGGASPGEAIADSIEEPRDVTTPDAPADVEDVAGTKNPGK